MVPPLAVKDVVCPLQISVSPIMVTIGKGFTINVTFAESLHPFISVTVTI